MAGLLALVLQIQGALIVRLLLLQQLVDKVGQVTLEQVQMLIMILPKEILHQYIL